MRAPSATAPSKVARSAILDRGVPSVEARSSSSRQIFCLLVAGFMVVLPARRGTSQALRFMLYDRRMTTTSQFDDKYKREGETISTIPPIAGLLGRLAAARQRDGSGEVSPPPHR